MLYVYNSGCIVTRATAHKQLAKQQQQTPTQTIPNTFEMHTLVWIAAATAATAATAVENLQRRAWDWMNSVWHGRFIRIVSHHVPYESISRTHDARLHSVFKQYQWTVSYWLRSKSRVFSYESRSFVRSFTVNFVRISRCNFGLLQF